MLRWFVLFIYNRIYIVILFEKKKNFFNILWFNCYSKYCVRFKGYIYLLDNICILVFLCIVY